MERSCASESIDRTAFINPSEEKFEHLKRCIGDRLDAGFGECFFELGAGGDGNSGLNETDLEASRATLERIGTDLNAQLCQLRDVVVGSSVKSQSKSAKLDQTNSSPTEPAGQKIVRDYLIRRLLDLDDFVDLRVAVVGNVDAGKSTLLGVLTHNELDNGRGQARLRLLRHKHEAESGRTSSVSNNIVGFSPTGQLVNKPVHGQLDWAEICRSAGKVITFIDLAGHERYLKTTIFGMAGLAPDYVVFLVGANAGLVGMAKEHLGIALALNLPIFVVVTKIDMCPPNVLQETNKQLTRLLKSPGVRKLSIQINSVDDVVTAAKNFTSERICPIFHVSNVSGDGLSLLRQFLNLLSPRYQPRTTEPAHYQVDEIFSVPGVGCVVAGTCISGTIKLNDQLLIGPDSNGSFVPVLIKSVHRKRLPVTCVRGGQAATFALKRIKRGQVRKGMVLVSPSLNPQSCMEFTAEIMILHHPSTISLGYQAMVHAGAVRQSATIQQIDGHEQLRTGDKGLVKFRFIKLPEYLYKGLRIIFREGKTKAVGTVTDFEPLKPSDQRTSQASASSRRNRRTSNNPAVAATSNSSGRGRYRRYRGGRGGGGGNYGNAAPSTASVESSSNPPTQAAEET